MGSDHAGPVEAFLERRDAIRTDMGGTKRIAALRADGKMTARERIATFVDPDSFDEIGTFATSEELVDRSSTPGDGTIVGHGTLGGRPI